MAGKRQRDHTASKEHVVDGILDVFIYTRRRSAAYDAGSVHTGRVLRRGGNETVSCRETVFHTGN